VPSRSRFEDERADIVAVEIFRARLTAGEEELIPAEFVNRMIDGENKVRVWREYRGLSASDLAEKAGIAIEKMDQLERGASDGSLDAIEQIATALGTSADDLT